MKGKNTLVGRETAPTDTDNEEDEEGEQDPPAEQQKLPGASANQAGPDVIKNGLLLMRYVKTHYRKNQDDEISAVMDFSLPLLKEHEHFKMPDPVLKHWSTMKKSDMPYIGMKIAPHSIGIHLVPDLDAHIEIEYGTIENAELVIVEEKGSGKKQSVTRFSFRVVCECEGPGYRDLRDFADTRFDSPVWVKMTEIQGNLIK